MGSRRRQGSREKLLLGLTLALAGGCAAPMSPVALGPTEPTVPRALLSRGPEQIRVMPRSDIVQAAFSEESQPAGPGAAGLDDLIARALENHPELAAAQARVESARGRLVQAGLYPNPSIGYSGDDVGDPTDAAGKQGGFIAQEFVTAGKLRLAQAAAAEGVAVADWEAVTRRYAVITAIRQAYFEAAAAERELRENADIVQLAEKGDGKETKGFLEIARALEAIEGFKPERLKAEIEVAEARNRREISQRRADAARRALAATAGLRELPANVLADFEGPLESPPPEYRWNALAAMLYARSSELQTAQAVVRQAEQELLHAQAQAIPNFRVKVHPFHSFPDDNTQVAVEAEVALPLFNRNQGNILAAQAGIARAGAELEATEFRLTERLAAAFQRYQIAREQVKLYQGWGGALSAIYQRGVVSKARESLEAMWLLYNNAKAEERRSAFLSVVDAYRILVNARLGYSQALGELWRAVSEIRGLLQE